MSDFKVGDIVTIPATKVIGTVVYINEKRQKYLVRINGVQQLYYMEKELELYKK